MNPYVAVSLSWDLPSLFAPASSPARRAEAHAAFDVVAREIHEAWDARRLALQDLALLPVDDEQTLLRRSLDLAELNARLEVLSGVPFPALGGDAGRALQRLPPSPSALELVDDATTRLGVGAARVQGLADGAWWRPAWPTLLVSGSFAESRLDEDDFLDEVGLERPWITKSALGQAFDVGARLAWDLPHTLRRGDDVDVGRLAWLRRDVAFGVTTAWFERARAQAHRLNATAKSDDDDDDDLAVEELTALLTGLTGRPSLALSPRSPP